MDTMRIIKVKQSVLANNDSRAETLRKKLKEKGVFLINVMSSPGAGKTTLLINLINKLKEEFKIGVIEADMDAIVDANTIKEKTGVKTIQLHTSGECHLDAKMVDEGIEFLNYEDLDLIFLENIGNLVCPAEFDTGATLKMVLLSIPEGDDKPLKYPLMFEKGDIFIFTKIDCIEYFDFSIDTVKKNIDSVNDKAIYFPVSAKKDIGVDELASYIKEAIKRYHE